MYEDQDIDDPVPALPDLPPVQQPHTPEMTVIEFWRKFTAKQALELISESWKEINEETINHARRRLVPHLCSEKPGQRIQQVSEAERTVLASARGVAGCEGVTQEEMRELLQEECQTAEVTMERVDQEDEQSVSHEENTNQPQNLPEEMTMHNLSNILLGVAQLKEIITANERDRFKAEEMCYALDKTFRDYDVRHKEGVNQRKQSLITKFLCPTTTTAASTSSFEPAASASTTAADDAAASTSTGLEDLNFEGFEAAVNAYRSRQDVLATGDESESSEDDDGLSGPQ